MYSWIKTTVLGLAVLGLAACGADTAETPAVAEAETAPSTEIETTGAAPGGVSDEEVRTLCIAAVADQTGVDGITVTDIEMEEDGTTVTLDVPEAQAPWICAVEADGTTIADVFYSGDEGAL